MFNQGCAVDGHPRHATGYEFKVDANCEKCLRGIKWRLEQ
jgi:hypothetical protein